MLSMAGLDWPVPDFATLSRRRKTIEVEITHRRAAGPLNLLKALGERIASRDPNRQAAEIHIRVAIMNRFNAFGTAEIERVA